MNSLQRSRLARGSALVASLVAAGCAAGSSSGALGQAHVSADCPSADLTCAGTGLDGPLAVGGSATLQVMLTFQGAATPPTRLVSSHPDVLAVSGTSALGMAAGSATLLVMLAAEDTVIDFLHVWVAAPDRVAVELFSADGTDLGEAQTGAQLLAGEALVLAPRLYARGQQLVGEVDATWSSDTDVVTLLREPTGGRTRVVARQPGAATVTVQAGGLSATLDVEVLP
jgi:hypothetical protein